MFGPEQVQRRVLGAWQMFKKYLSNKQVAELMREVIRVWAIRFRNSSEKQKWDDVLARSWRMSKSLLGGLAEENWTEHGWWVE